MSLIDELKQIDIISFLSTRGFTPKSETTSKVWYNSPLRAESSPSFFVHKATNRWTDYGFSDNRKHSIIDLVEQLDGVDTIEAMTILRSNSDGKRFEPVEILNSPVLTVTAVLPKYIDARLLLYLKSRGISKNVYERYTKEVHYHFSNNPEKIFSAVGFKNDSGGWELRNSFHKYCVSPKTITFIPNGGHTMNVAEGFFDFLAIDEYFGGIVGDTVVLNGLGMLYKLIPMLNKYEKINLFLDKGVGAEAAVRTITSVAGVDKCYDFRYLYGDNNKDFNDFLVSNRNLAT